MTDRVGELLDILAVQQHLTPKEYQCLIEGFDAEAADYAAALARQVRRMEYGDSVFVWGLLELGNLCRNNCYYCEVRSDNDRCQRYRLTPSEIMECCEEAYALGIRSFILEGGENGEHTVLPVCRMIERIRTRFPDCSVGLSLGECSRETYLRMYRAGADRYLLRHETANADHYQRLHPGSMTLMNRMRCLYDLQEIGFQTGCGFMVGSPFQSPSTLAQDLSFIEAFKPAMCSIGPFIPQQNTPFRSYPAGSADLTLYLLSLLRLIQPNLLLPSTAALTTLKSNGHRQALLAGANVIMPNISPISVQGRYALSDGRVCIGSQTAECLDLLGQMAETINCRISVSRGDPVA